MKPLPDPTWTHFSVPATECPRIPAESLDFDTPFFPTDLVDESFSFDVEPLCP